MYKSNKYLLNKVILIHPFTYIILMNNNNNWICFQYYKHLIDFLQNQ